MTLSCDIELSADCNPKFQDQLIQDGFAGGQAAARRLLSALEKFALSTKTTAINSPVGDEDRVPDVKRNDETAASRELGSVIVQVFVNKSGLGTALVRVSVLPKP